MPIVMMPAWFYRQYDADLSLDVPAEGYGGWEKKDLPFDTGHSAIVSMHAWDCHSPDEYPGWHRAVEYIPRSVQIAQNHIKPLFETVRRNEIPIFHVADDSRYPYKYGGYEKTLQVYKKHSGSIPSTAITKKLPQGDVHRELTDFKEAFSFPGKHNIPDIEAGNRVKDILAGAAPLGDEPVAINGEQLHALCLEYDIDHLVYVGFAINWCLQYSPANMNEMAKRGAICSTIRQAVTAVENKESARRESNKAYALWLTALKNGFVYDIDDFMKALPL